ncbi:MAG: branched-chain amino acid ABC transporter permease [Alcaligenaceae bacterium]
MIQQKVNQKIHFDNTCIISLLMIAASLYIPLFSTNLLAYSVLNQIMMVLPAALSVFLMLRMDLLSFAVPAFMCLGGYAAALCAMKLSTNVFVLIAISFIVPMLAAIPIGAMILKLRGVYFVLVTYVMAEILQLVLVEFPELTGGTNGLTDLPASTIFGAAIISNQAILIVAILTALLAAVVTFFAILKYHKQFDAIRENELLARSLGLVVWHYKAIGFALAAGLAGLSGYSVVNMLLTAHPSSFTSISGVNYIAYAYIGGQAVMLGSLIGSTLLVWATNYFRVGGEYSPGMLGLLIIVVVLVSRGGIYATLLNLYYRFRKNKIKESDPLPTVERRG